MARDVQKTNYH